MENKEHYCGECKETVSLNGEHLCSDWEELDSEFNKLFDEVYQDEIITATYSTKQPTKEDIKTFLHKAITAEREKCQKLLNSGRGMYEKGVKDEKERIKMLIVKEIATASNENTSTSRLTNLYNKI